jgi:hypothetical protein
MNIIEKRIDDLIMYENNPKIHTDEQIDKIAKSIELTKGLRQPIVIDKNNVIVVGHGRVQAAMQLGLETVPCELADDLTEEEIRAYRLIDNELAKGESDLDLLEQELASFNDIDMGEFFDEFGENVSGSESEQISESEQPNLSSNFNYKEQYGVIVMCKDEREQEKIYTRLTDEGFSCKVVAV